MPFAIGELSAARAAALRSYVLSVCKVVEDYQQEHGEYPPTLAAINRSNLDVDFGISLEELDYQATDDGYRVAYRRPNGEEIAGPMTNNLRLSSPMNDSP
ncbi:hypothetical protein [Posidoniimonas polymericola]|uniref:hypothetical protein n=1 Tax=Posidoniimonas polymericola TaxID=2528002 RepID=UPI0011B6214D|nr:hypothetical protein [Posidoniimonas polymericola]